uniref:Uncharacterized protein n=1 Tax=viral metagenome TaxID=1070528 RepID=A0A6H1ZV11_9ZZZZ
MGAIIKANARQTTSVQRPDEGAEVELRLIRDGSIAIADYITAMSLEGRIMSTNAGTVTTPIECGAGGIDTTEPDLIVIAPATVAIIPIEIIINVEAYGSTAIFEAMWSFGLGGVQGTVTAGTVQNTNTLSAYQSQCTSGNASGADSTYWTSKAVEVARWNAAKAVTVSTADDDSAWPPVQFVWTAASSGVLPVISGTGAGFMVFASAQASTAFITAKWIELPVSAVR